MSDVRLEQHPDYPFRSGREEKLEALAAEFLDAPAEGTLGRRALSEFIVLSHRFAFLERLIQGGILYDLPVHPNAAVASGRGLLPEDEGERLAEAESALLDWSAGAASELAGALDEIGIKIFVAGAGGAAREPQDDLFGAFYFAGEVGPTLLVGAEGE